MTAHLPEAKRGPGFRTVSVSSYSSSASSVDEYIEVPKDLNSLEFLTFAGFTNETARVIYDRWLSLDQSIFDSYVVDFARGHIEGHATIRDAIYAEDNWDGVLVEMGINARLREAILNPRFDVIRVTRSASFWAIDTINEAYEFLTSLTKRIESIQARQSLLPMRPFSQGESSTSVNSPIATIAESSPPANIENRNMYYQGGVERKLLDCLDADGRVNLIPLFSKSPTDFHPTKSGCVYLTQHKHIAELYAGYCEERSSYSKAAVLHIALPSSLSSSPVEVCGDDWRDLVWYSRNPVVAKARQRLPSSLQLYEEADMLIGNICGDSTEKIGRMAVNSCLTALRLSDSDATQLVLQSEALQEEIERDCVGFAWIRSVSQTVG